MYKSDLIGWRRISPSYYNSDAGSSSYNSISYVLFHVLKKLPITTDANLGFAYTTVTAKYEVSDGQIA